MKNKNKVLIIIPAYNEADNIVGVINSIWNLVPEYDIVVIDDGSSDNTASLAKATQKAFVISLPYNIGIGGSVQTGFKFAEKHDFQYAIQFDGDGQHLVEEIDKILDPVINRECDCVIGSRFVQNTENYKPDFFRKLGIYILRFFSYLYMGQIITDQTSGFRAYNEKCIGLLAAYYPKDYPEPELIILLGRNRLKINEIHTQMRERQGGVSSIPVWKGPYYIIKVLVAMSMARLRKKEIDHK
ncbi:MULTISPECIES: glycosyltransferase family 2 protein [unclassified Lentimicrobium]|uniref:glycosyltransferase family 2 protein n=1 Tax=unclassified Lentimicrobium TaxID=2677434 RepID=UPI001557B59D|nr:MULTISPECIES: glycosyltransferase family 2 protein [unclassified Lentimicrobium]NPD45546.1 glycosyltransferase family 2 protein [Lentimicrobium sp. S6]NPD83625.1 glycosyltransferase family 2 protein [Lentimicrobium sp. L6]